MANTSRSRGGSRGGSRPVPVKEIKVPVVESLDDGTFPEVVYEPAQEPPKARNLAGYVKVGSGGDTTVWWCVKSIIDHPENIDAFTRRANRLGLEWCIVEHRGEEFRDWPPVGPNGVGRGVPGAGVGVSGGWE